MNKLITTLLSLVIGLGAQSQLPVNLVDVSLIGYWPLDTSVDIDDTLPGQVFTTPDMSLYENDGVFLTPYNSPDVPNMPLGRFGNSVSLSGINNHGRIRLDGILDGMTVDGPDSIRTASFWIKISSTQTSHFLMSDGGGINVDPISAPFDTWTNVIALVRPMGIGTNFAVYVNGVLQNWYVNSSDNLIIGGPSFVGLIDDVAIWNRSLTAQEIIDIQSQSPTSIKPLSKVDVSVYPNPTDDIARVTWQYQDNISQVVVFDNLGKIVYLGNILTDTYVDVPLFGLPSGVYNLSLIRDNQVVFNSRISKN